MRLGWSMAILLVSSMPALGATVNYSVRFDATWSSGTYPAAYPSGAHFSPLVGGVHNAQASFWSPGQLASPGIEAMAELGVTVLLRSEVQAAITQGRASSIIAGSGAPSPGSVSTVFTVSDDFPLVTLVTMVAPSPDWFVGVHDLDLRGGSGFVESLVVPLRGYDAGTDHGVDFTSADIEAVPHVPIGLLGAPFAATGPELGRFTFTRIAPTPEPSGVLALAGVLVSVRRWRR